jgi:hypothetical protein
VLEIEKKSELTQLAAKRRRMKKLLSVFVLVCSPILLVLPVCSVQSCSQKDSGG